MWPTENLFHLLLSLPKYDPYTFFPILPSLKNHCGNLQDKTAIAAPASGYLVHIAEPLCVFFLFMGCFAACI